jgi:hypothetical protein
MQEEHHPARFLARKKERTANAVDRLTNRALFGYTRAASTGKKEAVYCGTRTEGGSCRQIDKHARRERAARFAHPE